MYKIRKKPAVSKVTVVAKVVAKTDCVVAVKTELLKLIVPTRKEDGCIEYKLNRDNENPAVFIFYETWESPSHLQKHTNTDHYKAYVQAVGDLIAEKIVHKMTLIE